MLADAVELVKSVKKAAVDAVDASKPVNVCFGTVESVNPLAINVEQRMTLRSPQLVLSRNVTDYSVCVTVNWQTESHSQPASQGQAGETKPGGIPEHTHEFETAGSSGMTHAHPVSGRKEITVHNALEAGEKVILLREQGGQKYIVLDRIGGM